MLVVVLSISGPDHFYSSVRSRNFSGRPSQSADGRVDVHEHDGQSMAKNPELSRLGIVSLRVASAHGDPMPQTTAVEEGGYQKRSLFDGGAEPVDVYC